MRTKEAFLIGGMVGYVLGTRNGRDQLERVTAAAKRAWDDPRVQEKVTDASQRAATLVQEMAPELKDKVGDAVRQAGDALRGNGA